ncbi:hypothetical protein T02_8081 [Trichinella nativa]|uniref:Neuroguidin n=1 Tax=Trichinella nativa TaxID=6335 RepID=A0A0V1LQ29_9BILA|nr:hypothetical protein T02_8081 [Trichinella nativa]
MVFTDAYKMSDVIMNGKKFDKIYEDIVENACIAHEILRKCNGFAVETICKERGINLMEVKFHVLMNYVALLKYIILKNSVGKDSADESLVEISTVLGRTRPLIEKMSNEMQKLLESVSSDDEQDGQDIGHICRCFTYSTVIDDNKLQYSHADEDIMDQQEGNEQQSGTECEEEFIAVRLNDPKKKDGNQNGKIPIIFNIIRLDGDISHTQLLELRDILRYLTEPTDTTCLALGAPISIRCACVLIRMNSAFIPTSTIHLIPRKDYTVISTEKQKRKNIFQKYSEVPLTAVIRGQKLEPRLNLPYG